MPSIGISIGIVGLSLGILGCNVMLIGIFFKLEQVLEALKKD